MQTDIVDILSYILIILVLIGAFYFINTQRDTIIKTCLDAGLKEDCNEGDYCEKDCFNLGLKFFKYEPSLFGGSECWCLRDNISTQIW